MVIAHRLPINNPQCMEPICTDWNIPCDRYENESIQIHFAPNNGFKLAPT